jgi:AraC-like DNA-binding protein
LSAAVRRRSAFRVLAPALAGVELVSARSDHRFPRHVHDVFGIGLVVAGGHASASGMGPVEAGPGDVITVEPGEVHDGRPVGGRPRTWRMAYLQPDSLRALVDDGARYAFRGPVLSDPGLARAVRALLDALAATATATTTGTGAGPPDEALGERLAFVLGAAAAPGRGPGAPGAHVPDAVARVLARLRADPADGASLEALARPEGLSRFQLLRGITAATGLPPHAYRVQLRLDRARALLRDGRSLAEAAAGAGFADQSHFTRLFARRHGTTPGAWLRAVHAPAPQSRSRPVR